MVMIICLSYHWWIYRSFDRPSVRSSLSPSPFTRHGWSFLSCHPSMIGRWLDSLWLHLSRVYLYFQFLISLHFSILQIFNLQKSSFIFFIFYIININIVPWEMTWPSSTPWNAEIFLGRYCSQEAGERHLVWRGRLAAWQEGEVRQRSMARFFGSACAILHFSHQNNVERERERRPHEPRLSVRTVPMAT